MNDPDARTADAHAQAKLRKVALGILAVILLFGVGLVRELDRRQVERNRFEPLSALEAPLRMRAAGGDRVYLLTTQVEHPLVTRTLWRSRSIDAGQGRVNIDLWALDATTLEPLWRRRISQGEGRELHSASLLGADGDAFWIHAGQLLALSARDGKLLADGAVLLQRTPGLAGQLVGERRYYGMDAAGAWLLDAQARHWRLDGGSFVATPIDRSRPAARNPQVVLPAKSGAGQGLNYHQQRGVNLEDRWLGLFSAQEMERLQASRSAAHGSAGPVARMMAAADAESAMGSVDGMGQRRRMWLAERRMVSAAPEGWNDPMPDGSPSILPDNWGKKARYSNFKPLPRSREYLDGGLLALETHRGHPIVLREPDSVLVLHRDRLGEHGQYRLARVAGPDGEERWNALLPLTNINAVLPGDDSLVVLGRWFQTDDELRARDAAAREANPRPWLWRWLDAGEVGTALRDSWNDAAEQLVAIDHASGRVSKFELGGPLREFPASPVAQPARTD